MQTEDGAIQNGATRLGITFEEYSKKLSLGQKWCCYKKHWTNRKGFSRDVSRSDMKASICNACSKIRYKLHYKPKLLLPKPRRKSNEG